MEAVESAQFDPSAAAVETEQAKAVRKGKIQRMVAEQEKKTAEKDMFEALPSIPSKGDVLKQQIQRNRKKSKKMVEGKYGKVGLEPSIKPFFKRSLQPERLDKADEKLMSNMMGPERVRLRKTTSFTKKTLTAWSHSSFNQTF